MKTAKNVSPYSKMYLVPPIIYEKLLNVLEEKEIRQVEDINIDPEMQEKPGEKQMELLSREALTESEPQMEQVEPEIITENIPQAIETNPETVETGMETVPETEILQPEEAPLANLKKGGPLKGVVAFDKPLFTCEVCLKTFGRKYDLNRHTNTVHRNLQNVLTGIPATLKIQQSQPPSTQTEQIAQVQPISQSIPTTSKPSVQFVPDESVEMIQDIPKKSCKVSSETTSRVIPDMPQLMFKPPRSREMILPNIKKRMMLVPSFKKNVRGNPRLKAKDLRKVKLNIPMKKTQPTQPEPSDIEFEDWSKAGESKKRGTRTGTEANLRMKPAKWYRTVPGIEVDEFADWK
jgi:hypothetical protein